jgi:type IV secretion system protein VirB10
MIEENTVAEAIEDGISPVTQARKSTINAKAFFTLAASGVVILALAAVLIARFGAQRRQDAADKQAASQAATAASAGAQPLKITGNPAGHPPTAGGVQPAVAQALPDLRAGSEAGPGLGQIRIPAIDPGESGAAPIGVYPAQPGAMARTAAGARASAQPLVADPYDAPVLLTPAPALQDAGRASFGAPGSLGAGVDSTLEDGMAQTRARLEETRARLEQALKSVGAGQGSAAAQVAVSAAGAAPGGQEQGVKISSTARAGAARLVAPSLTLARGTTFGCALASKIVSDETGAVSCVVSRNVYGSDGRVLLIERGSHLDGAYHAQVRVGQSRVSVLWERLRMPNGVVVDLASPATGALGEAGVDGFVDNHWPGRIGAALLLSLIDDAVKIDIAREQAKGNASGTVLLQGSGSETSTLAGKVLDSTINIPPTIVKNQGEIVAVNVAQDVDFSTVYELRASTL